MGVAVAAGLAAAILFIGVLAHKPSPPPAPAPVAVVPDAGPAVAVAPPAPSTAPDGGVDATAAAPAPSDAGAVVAAAPSDAGAAAAVATAADPTSLELVVEPPVDASVDGAPAERTPFTVPLAPGKHRVQVTDQHRGINFVRNVTVGPKGKTHEEIRLEHGFVTISAPDGAAVTIDGRNMGRAPLKGELTLYEGAHRILVTVGKAKWQQAFSIRPSEHAYFNVEAQ